MDARTVLEAQLIRFASDDHIREEVAAWADASPAERLAELASMCAASEPYWQQLDDARLERMRKLRELDPAAITIFEALRQQSR